MTDDTTARIDKLEEMLAHQEQVINDLSDELAKQWQTIERMTRKAKHLEEKVESMKSVAASPGGGEPPPPHY
jgi:SlyX protein